MAVKVIQPQGVCSRQITVEYDDNGVITSCQFVGGCQGNTGKSTHEELVEIMSKEKFLVAYDGMTVGF